MNNNIILDAIDEVLRQLRENKIPTNPVVELVETWG